MNTFKTLLAMAALAGSAYAVYVSIFETPSDLPPEQAAADLGFEAPSFSGPVVGPAPMPLMTPGGDAPPAWGTPGLAPPDGASPFNPAASASPFAGPNASPFAAPNGENPGGPAAAPAPNAWADPFAGASPLGAAPPIPGGDDAGAMASASPYPNANPAGPAGELTPLERPAGVGERNVAASDPGAAGDPQPDLAAVAQDHLDKNRLDEALKLLSAYYDWEPGTALPPEDHEVLVDLLDQLAGTVIYSREDWRPTFPHQVRPGETIEQIAQANNIPAGLLAKVNGLSPTAALPPGMTLKVIPGPFEAVIDLEQRRLTLRVGGLYAGRFAIGLGENAPTTSGELVVRDKVDNPTYNSPNGPIAGGAPGNPLGARWIDLGDGIAIHALADDSRVAAPGGPGSVRVSARDADDLFDILAIGSRVVIHAGAAAPAAPASSAPTNPAGVAAVPGYENAAPPGYASPASYPTTPGAAPPGYAGPPGIAAPPGYAAPPMASDRPFGASGDLR